MKSYARVFAVCAIFAVGACDPMPEHYSKNYQGLVPEVVEKLNTLKNQIQVLSDHTPRVANEVRSCYNHISNELQMIRTDTASGIETCSETIYIDIFYTYQAIKDYVSSIQENWRFMRETFKANCEKASYFEYLQCIADSLEESQNARIAIEKNFVEIYNVFAPRVRDMLNSSRNCVHSVFRSAVKNAFEISCQSEKE